MTRAQELALDHIREAEIANEAAMDWLRERVAELESENAQLRAELEKQRALAVAVCIDCGNVTRCDEDRCCLTCGRDLIILSDQHSADLLRAELEELAPMRAVQDALHTLILRSDVVQYHAPSNTLTLGPATFAALGDQTILRGLATAAKAFTEDK